MGDQQVFVILALILLFLSGELVEAGRENIMKQKKQNYNFSAITKFPQTQITPFIALYHGSQGSTWFVEALSELNGVCVVGNELIDRVTELDDRMNFIERATQPPKGNMSAFENWEMGIKKLASQDPSPYDIKFMAKCFGNETAFGYKARLSFEEMRYVFSDDVQSRLHIKIIILSRNPVKQSLSAYRRDFEHHDQRVINGLAQSVDNRCRDRDPSNPYCADKVREYEKAKSYTSTIDFVKFKFELFNHLQYYQERDKELGRLMGGDHAANVMEISYEEMEENMEATLRDKILPFLNIRPGSVEAQVNIHKKSKDFFRVKATQHLMCEAIANFSTMCDFMRTNATLLMKNGRVFTGMVGPMNMTLLQYTNVDACPEGGDPFVSPKHGHASGVSLSRRHLQQLQQRQAQQQQQHDVQSTSRTIVEAAAPVVQCCPKC